MDEKSTVATPDLGAILNFIFAPLFMPIYFINQMLSLPAPMQMPAALPAAKSPAAVMQTNEERWIWRDCKGREREITVYRKVKGSE